MKAVFIFCLAIGLPLLIASENCKHREFIAFKHKFQKSYPSPHEELRRCEIFTKNFNGIQERNQLKRDAETSHVEGITEFADITLEEFRAKRTGYRPTNPSSSSESSENEQAIEKAPAGWVPSYDNLDLRVSQIPIKNQKDCGSCWVFAATGVWEYYLYQRNRQYRPLSEQMGVDCERIADGCEGGYSVNMFRFFKTKGADYESVYPYKAVNQRCRYRNTTNPDNGVSNKYASEYYLASNDEKDMMYLLEEYGWMTVAINADALQLYQGGVVLREPECYLVPNHAVILVGYGTDEFGTPYWLLRNSWGSGWGEEGYFRMERGKNSCDIANDDKYSRIYLKSPSPPRRH